MQISVTYKEFYIRHALHVVLLQVLSELSDCAESVGGLDVLAVVSNDDGLASLEGDDALLALDSLSVTAPNKHHGQ